MDIKDLIKSIGTGKTSDAKEAFDTLIKSKLKDRIELKRVEVASNIYNKLEDEK